MTGQHVENADIQSLREKGRKEPPQLLRVEGLPEREPNLVINFTRFSIFETEF